VTVREMKVLNVKMETVTLTGKGRQDLTCLVLAKYFFLADILLGGGLRFRSIQYILHQINVTESKCKQQIIT
jgi:hypothetical protein